MHPQAIGPVPEETVRVARAAYPKGNLSLRLRDHLGTIYEDGQFATLWQPAHEPWRLALNAHRAGIEGTISQAVRTCEVRRSRYRGLPKTHLHHMLTATALNVWRIGMWLAEEPLGLKHGTLALSVSVTVLLEEKGIRHLYQNVG